MIQPGQTVDDAHRAVKEDLIQLAAPEADRVRALLADAVQEGDAKTIRSEGHHWSGHIALAILQLADRVEETTTRDGAPRRTGYILEDT
ncbi:hypothetical protein [Streptomyces sp. SM13]|uniref:hypothetical protein n=1 Tax=Streptomyces sp. SM13 TaxID=1983803 RepID=UPI000CD5132C|nr:hypothetical protein [Streptomyces sp. SM13]